MCYLVFSSSKPIGITFTNLIIDDCPVIISNITILTITSNSWGGGGGGGRVGEGGGKSHTRTHLKSTEFITV